MTKPKVIVDVDGILCDIFTPIMLYAHQKHGKDIKYKDFNYESDDLKSIIQEYIRKPERLIQHCLPYSDARCSLILLSTEFSPIIGTARFGPLMRATEAWLMMNNMWDLIDGFVYREEGEKRNEFKVRATEDAVAVIDDTPGVITELANKGRNVFTVRRPWNQNIKDSANISVYPSLYECVKDMIRRKDMIQDGL